MVRVHARYEFFRRAVQAWSAMKKTMKCLLLAKYSSTINETLAHPHLGVFRRECSHGVDNMEYHCDAAPASIIRMHSAFALHLT